MTAPKQPENKHRYNREDTDHRIAIPLDGEMERLSVKRNQVLEKVRYVPGWPVVAIVSSMVILFMIR
jgi:hypothetical protein